MSIITLIVLGAIALAVVALVVQAIPALVKVLFLGLAVVALLYVGLRVYKGGL